MPFMDLYSNFGTWYVVDGPSGGAVIPTDVPFISPIPDLADMLQRGDAGFADLERALLPYYEGSRLDTIELVRGWCARYSAAGYLDCTDWCGPYATEDEALQACREVYGDDEDDEADDEGDDLADEIFDNPSPADLDLGDLGEEMPR
jgi:hypothetical protein